MYIKYEKNTHKEHIFAVLCSVSDYVKIVMQLQTQRLSTVINYKHNVSDCNTYGRKN